MVKHIVLFKLKEEAPAGKKLEAARAFKEAIEALPSKIPFVRQVEVGLNINPGESIPARRGASPCTVSLTRWKT